MSENPVQPDPSGMYTPPDEDIRRATELPIDACPRRYCWWWRSLSFKWDVALSHGCTFIESKKPPGIFGSTVPCKRCDPNSTIDHYEPEEGYLKEDGFPEDRWIADKRHPGEIYFSHKTLDHVAERIEAYPVHLEICEHAHPHLHRIMDIEAGGQAYEVLRCAICDRPGPWRLRPIESKSDAPGVPFWLEGDGLKRWIQDELDHPSEDPIDWEKYRTTS